MKKNKKPIVALVLLLVVGLVGLTLAYFTDTVEVPNVFNTSTYSTETTEEFESPDDWTPGTTTSKTVITKNTGDVDVAVRVSYTEKWEKDGKTVSNTFTNNGTTESAAKLNLTNTSDWTKDGDYYYYNKKLASGESTSTFLESVTFNENVPSSSETSSCTTKYYDADGAEVESTADYAKQTTTCSADGDYVGATYTLTIKVETVQYDAYKDYWGTTVEIS